MFRRILIALMLFATAAQAQLMNPVPTPVLLAGYTIATLPNCNGAAKGLMVYVTNGVASPVYLAAVSTTGASYDKVFCNGTNWVYD
jgi:hypothetical protein